MNGSGLFIKFIDLSAPEKALKVKEAVRKFLSYKPRFPYLRIALFSKFKLKGIEWNPWLLNQAVIFSLVIDAPTTYSVFVVGIEMLY